MRLSDRSTTGFHPIRIIDVELTEPPPALPEAGPARLLLRNGGRPVGFVPIVIPVGGMDSRAVAETLAALPDVNDSPSGGGASASGGVRFTASTARTAPPVRPTVTVVVTTCAASRELLRTLEGMLTQSLPPDEILVVDNRPGTSGVPRLLESARMTGVTLVEERRKGLSYARNAALALARSEIIAYTDDDVVVDPGWLAALVDGFADPTVACVTGLVLPLELNTPAQCWFEEFGGFAKGFHQRRYNLTGDRGDGPLYPYAAGVFGTGANAAFRVSALRGLGGFDLRLGTGTPARGGEDLDIFLTIVQSGATLLYEPAALVRHQHRRTTEALRKQMFGYGVGLSAMVTKRLVTSPEERRELLARASAGLRHVLHPASPKNHGKSGSYPATLTMLEIAGLLLGPIAYWRSGRSQ